MTAVRTETRTHMVRARVEPHLATAVDQLAAREGVERSEMVRQLLGRGITSALQEQGVAATPPVSRPVFAQRLAFLVELVSDLLSRREQVDPAGALLGARGLLSSLTAYVDALESRLGGTDRA